MNNYVMELNKEIENINDTIDALLENYEISDENTQDKRINFCSELRNIVEQYSKMVHTFYHVFDNGVTLLVDSVKLGLLKEEEIKDVLDLRCIIEDYVIGIDLLDFDKVDIKKVVENDLLSKEQIMDFQPATIVFMLTLKVRLEHLLKEFVID